MFALPTVVHRPFNVNIEWTINYATKYPQLCLREAPASEVQVDLGLLCRTCVLWWRMRRSGAGRGIDWLWYGHGVEGTPWLDVNMQIIDAMRWRCRVEINWAICRNDTSYGSRPATCTLCILRVILVLYFLYIVNKDNNYITLFIG